MRFSVIGMIPLASTLSPSVTASVRAGNVRLETSGGVVVEIHPLWLRERCLSDSSVDASTRQPLHGFHEVVDGLLASNATTSATELVVGFSDGHSSSFPLQDILQEWSGFETTPVQSEQYEPPVVQTWNASLRFPPEVTYEQVFQPAGRMKFLSSLLTIGMTVVTDAPTEAGVCSALASNVSTLRPTEWGSVFNVKTVPDAQVLDGTGKKAMKDLAYTPQAIGFHVDNPYRDQIPSFQLLHAIEHCTCPDGLGPCPTCSVVNYAVDGWYVAEKLRQEDPEAFELLTTVPVRFENNGGDGGTVIFAVKPMIELAHGSGGEQRVVGIRLSPKSGGYAPPMPIERANKFYAARRKFSEMIHDEKHRLTFQLRPGDIWVFDNQRVLHSRSVIDPTQGARFLQGCYMNRDGLQAGHERHARAAAIANPNWTSLAETTPSHVESMASEYSRVVQQPLAERLLAMLDSQEATGTLGQPVTLREHGLQAATRAVRAGEDDDIVVMTLLHDVLESTTAVNHGGMAAAMLEPFLGEKATWILRHHEVVQMYYYAHHNGGDPNAREALSSSEHYGAALHWCEHYDQVAFDPAYPSLPLRYFRAMVHKVVGRPAYWWDATHPLRTASGAVA